MKKKWITITAYIVLLHLLLNGKHSEGHADQERYTKTEIQNLGSFVTTGMTGNYYTEKCF